MPDNVVILEIHSGAQDTLDQMVDHLLDVILMPRYPEAAEDLDDPHTELRHQGVRGQRQQPVGEDLQHLVTLGDHLLVPGESPDRPLVVALSPGLVPPRYRCPQPHETLGAGAQQMAGVGVMTEVLRVIGHESANPQEPLTVIITCYLSVTFAERFENQQLLENVRHEWVQTNKSHVLKIFVSCRIVISKIRKD